MPDTTVGIEGFGVYFPTANQPGQGYLEYRVLQQKVQDNFQGCVFQIWFGLFTRAGVVLCNRQVKGAEVHHLCLQAPNFYTMAEDLPYHVRAMKAVASSEMPNFFFNNVFVRAYLAKLQPQHRAIYRRILLRLLRVYVDCQNKEVGFFF